MKRTISSRNKKTCKITARDHQVLRFLWKWKLASTTAIACRFFPKINLLSGLRRLQFLETDKYIKCIQISPEQGHVWSLTDRGFKYIRHSLKDIEHMGYKSEHLLHDYLVTAFHLGEWLTKQPTKSENFSEQQLRRNTQSTWPIWVPKSLAHRPDGYSICTYQGQKMLVAFEVELPPVSGTFAVRMG